MGVYLKNVMMPSCCHDCDVMGLSHVEGIECEGERNQHRYECRPASCPLQEFGVPFFYYPIEEQGIRERQIKQDGYFTIRIDPTDERKDTKNMDTTALNLVEDYIVAHLDKSEEVPQFEVYTVWKAKVLQNWKYLIASTLQDGMYYELTYNGDKEEWYLDAYKKFENRRIKG